MIGFALVAAGLAALALVLVLPPLVARRTRASVSRRTANIAVYKDELRELDADLAAGTLAREDYERSRLELEARLLEDAAADEPPSRPGGRRAALAVGVALPMVALAVYFAAGNPRALLERQAMPDAAQ